MKKYLFLLMLLICSPAWATQHYFDNGSPDNTLPCTEADPCDNFKGTTLDNTAAVACGDTINLKAGEIWEGSEAEITINSGTTSCSGNPIYVQRYGTGANPVLYGAAVTTAGWTVYSGSIYKVTGQSQTHLKTVAYSTTGAVADYKSLGYWSGTNTTLPLGSFKRESTTLYVRLHGGENPATSNVRIASFAHTADGNGSRGLLSAGSRVIGRNTYGHYVRFRDITIIGANGIGFSASGTNVWTAEITAIGCGMEGWLAYSDLSSSLENSDYWRHYGTTVSYCAAWATNTGAGQNVSYYSSYGWSFKLDSSFGWMAGEDFLNFGPSTNVTQTGSLWATLSDNGLAQVNPSYDPNLYQDGATRVFVYGMRAKDSGLGSGTAGNARAGVKIGSEHSTTDPAEETYIINSLIQSSHYIGLQTDNAYDAVQSIKDVIIAYNTIMAYDVGTNEVCFHFQDMDTTADNFRLRNNIFYADSRFTDDYITSASLLDSDYNLFYKRGSSSSTTTIFATGGSTQYSLAGWRTLSGEDASSVYGDPLLVSATDGAIDAHLGGGSPAINAGTLGAYTVPTWLPTALKNYLGTQGIRGTTIAAGTVDNFDVAPDVGFHYDYADLISANVEPASLVASVAGNVTVSFTIPDPMGYIPRDGKIKITLPAGFTISSGGTTAVSSMTISGTATVGISGQVMTLTRVGDGVSEFPGDFSITLTNILNPTAGVTGTYGIQILDSSDDIIAGNDAVTADTIVAGGSGVTSNRFSSGPGCSFRGFSVR